MVDTGQKISYTIRTIRQDKIMKETYTLVYAPEKSESQFSHQVYEVETHPNNSDKLFNNGKHVGFISNCLNRENALRAFRFDRIVSLARN